MRVTTLCELTNTWSRGSRGFSFFGATFVTVLNHRGCTTPVAPNTPSVEDVLLSVCSLCVVSDGK